MALELQKKRVESIREPKALKVATKAFDSLDKLLNTSRGVAKDLVEFHKDKKSIKQEIQSTENNTTNNNLFVGSTAELLKMIKDKNA